MKVKILYVEDEPFLGKVVKESLEMKGFEVIWVEDGDKVLEALGGYEADVCVLDVMLPGTDGFTLAPQIRKLRPSLPIIFLTAKSQITDLEEGFRSGGTDYLKKPFSVEELILRIHNQIRLSKGVAGPAANGEVVLGKYTFSPQRYELRHGDKAIRLTHRESQVLQKLSESRNSVVHRKDLLLEVWGDDSIFNSRNLDVYIRKLREYLAEDSQLEIVTLKGHGYHFIAP